MKCSSHQKRKFEVYHTSHLNVIDILNKHEDGWDLFCKDCKTILIANTNGNRKKVCDAKDLCVCIHSSQSNQISLSRNSMSVTRTLPKIKVHQQDINLKDNADDLSGKDYLINSYCSSSDNNNSNEVMYY